MIFFFYSYFVWFKYVVECKDYILKIEVMLLKFLVMRVIFGIFVDLYGKKGGNKLVDM